MASSKKGATGLSTPEYVRGTLEESRLSTPESDRLIASNVGFSRQNNEESEAQAIDESSLYSSVSSLPDVEISKIKLEYIGGDIIVERNPHIDDVEGANIVIDEFGKATFVSKGIDYLTKTTTSEYLQISLRLTIREVLDSGGTGTWFDNENILKYLRIKVLQSTSAELTSEIRQGIYSLDRTDYSNSEYKKYAEEKIISIQPELKKITKYNSTKTSSGSKVYDITFDASFVLRASAPSHVSYFLATYLDSEQLAADHGCTSGNLLALGTKTEFGRVYGESVISNFDVSKTSYAYTTESGKYWKGPVSFDSDLNSYIGARAGDSGPVLTRSSVENLKIEDMREVKSAEEIEIEFSIIEDSLLTLSLASLQPAMMAGDRIAEYFSDLYATRDKTGSCRAAFGFNYQKYLRDNTEFGKLLEHPDVSVVDSLSRLCKISFVKISRERVLDHDTLNALNMPLSGRTNFNNYGLHRIGGPPSETIVYSADDSRGNLKTYTRQVDVSGGSWEKSEAAESNKTGLRPTGTLREVTVYPIEENNIRHFAFLDSDISSATDGLYRYGVDIVVEDGTSAYMKSLVEKLYQAKVLLDRYYNDASSRTFGKLHYNYHNKQYSRSYTNEKNALYPVVVDGRIKGVTSKIFSDLWDKSSSPPVREHVHKFIVDKNGNGRTTTVSGHYHVVENYKVGKAISAKTKKEIKLGHIHYSNILGSRKDSPWVSSIATYLEVVDVLTMGKSDIDYTNLAKMLDYMTNPTTGSPDGILRLSQLMQSLISKLNTLIVSAPSISARASTRSHRDGGRMLRMQKWFDYIFDANVEKLVGYDYLSTRRTAESGLRLLLGNYYIERAKSETDKYFSIEAGASPLINVRAGQRALTNDSVANMELSYLSPATAYVGGKAVNLMHSDKLDSSLSSVFEIENKILQYNSGQTAQALTPTANTEEASKQTTRQSLDNIYFAMGIHAGDISDSYSRQFLSAPVSALENVKTYLGEGSSMINKNLRVESLLKDDEGSLSAGEVSAIASINNSVLSKALDVVKQSSSNPFVSEQNPFSKLEGTTFDLSLFNSDATYSYFNKLSDQDFYELPNAVKSLFTDSHPIKNLSDLQLQTATVASQAESVLRFDFQLLKSVEVFVGYTQSEAESSLSGLIKDPIWEKLSYDLYNDSIGKTLLCRLKNYDNTSVGITYSGGISLPVYNEYFFLSPTSAVDVATTRSRRKSFKQYRDSLEKKRTFSITDILSTIASPTIEPSVIHSSLFVEETGTTKSKSGNFKSSSPASSGKSSTVSKSSTTSKAKSNTARKRTSKTTKSKRGGY